jgi:hypothetical protein
MFQIPVMVSEALKFRSAISKTHLYSKVKFTFTNRELIQNRTIDFLNNTK